LKRLVAAFFIIIISIVLIQIPSYGQVMNNKKVIILLVNRLALEDIDNMGNTKEIIKKEAIGLMNTRGNQYNNEYSSSATIGSGSRADAKHSTSRFENSNINTTNIYKRRTGFQYNGEAIINLNIPQLVELNKANNYNPSIGFLGDFSNELDLRTAVIGNSDIEDYKVRIGPLIVMDGYGLVDEGDIGKNTINSNPIYPYGFKTNYDYLKYKFYELYKRTNIIVIELGDLYRLESYKENLFDSRFVEHRIHILKEIDEFIDEIYNKIDLNSTRIMIINPYPSTIGYDKGERLTPLIIGGDDKPSGVLTSDTTRRKGIVTNIDITSEIVSFLNGSNIASGKPIDIIDELDNLTYIRELNNKTAFIYSNRINVLYTFAVYEIIISIISFVCIQMYGKHNFNTRLIKFSLLTNMAIPFIILILPIFNLNRLLSSLLLIGSLTFFVTLGAIIISRKNVDSLIILSGIITIGLIIDIITGSNMIKYSFLGYDPIIGARYYGIGNEYMGILVGATVIFVTSLLERYEFKKIMVVLFMGFVVFVIGAPNLGANVGGTITSVFSFSFVILRLYYKNLRIRHYVYIILLVMLLLLSLGIVDLFFIENKSHFANAISQVSNQGFVVIFSIIKRKLSMNIKLLGVTIWSKVLLLSLLFLGVLFYRPFGITEKISKKYPNLFTGLLGILIGAIVGFIVNDSGVVASATATIFLIMTFMYIIFKEFENRNERV